MDDPNGTIPQSADDDELWRRIRGELEIGCPLRGTVICRRPFGVFLDIGYGTYAPALLLVPEFREARTRRIDFDDYPQIGETVEGLVLHISWDQRKISLTQNQSFDSAKGEWNRL